jgi:uncharacterized Ntn-hydrolase superfamily protein
MRSNVVGRFMTFSIIARCERSGQFGVAAVTAVPAVGKLVTHAHPGAGAVATQARLNPYLGIDGVALLRQGLSADEVRRRLVEADPRIEARQFSVIDAQGRTAPFTGVECLDWAGSREGPGYSIQGNRLAGEHVIDAIAEAFDADPSLALAERLIDALEAGARAGGDTKGARSSTIYIVDSEEYPLWDIRVDEHDRPIEELRRLHGIFGRELLPEICRMPSRADPGGSSDEGFV